jgi:hypothetical protein
MNPRPRLILMSFTSPYLNVSRCALWVYCVACSYLALTSVQVQQGVASRSKFVCQPKTFRDTGISKCERVQTFDDFRLRVLNECSRLCGLKVNVARNFQDRPLNSLPIWGSLNWSSFYLLATFFPFSSHYFQKSVAFFQKFFTEVYASSTL